MDGRTADQVGRELAWVISHTRGLADDALVKEAGLLEGLIYAPLTALAAMFSAPWGSKMQSMGLGFLLGAGMGAVTDREAQQKAQEGKQVSPQEMSPLMKAVLAGVALGGAKRVGADVQQGRPIGNIGALLAGAPLGAMIASNPATGMAVGGVSSQLLSMLQGSKIRDLLSGARPPETAPPAAAVAGPQAQPLRLVPQPAGGQGGRSLVPFRLPLPQPGGSSIPNTVIPLR